MNPEEIIRQRVESSAAPRETLLETIGNLNPDWMEEFGRLYCGILRCFYDDGTLTDGSLEATLGDTALSHVRTQYNTRMAERTRLLSQQQALPVEERRDISFIIPAYLLGRKDCLAYALENEAFPPEEVSTIDFEGETPSDFVRKNKEYDLPKILKNELLYPSPLHHTNY